MSTSEIEDRRQRAREAYWDSISDRAERMLDTAVEVATQVRLTNDIIEAAQNAFPILRDVDEGAVMLRAAFTAAGFEVIE